MAILVLVPNIDNDRSLRIFFLRRGTSTEKAELAGAAWALRRCWRDRDTPSFVKTQGPYAEDDEEQEHQEIAFLGDGSALSHRTGMCRVLDPSLVFGFNVVESGSTLVGLKCVLSIA